jgi:hypothetical protein
MSFFNLYRFASSGQMAVTAVGVIAAIGEDKDDVVKRLHIQLGCYSMKNMKMSDSHLLLYFLTMTR